MAIAVGATGIGAGPNDQIQPRESPESAARALTAWQRGDRIAARKIADLGAVDKLFGTPAGGLLRQALDGLETSN